MKCAPTASSSPVRRRRCCRWPSGISCSRFARMSITKTASLAAYDKDFHDWAVSQARALRGRQLGALDWENLAEEIESLGRSDQREVTSRLTTLLVHLLKWRYQRDLR